MKKTGSIYFNTDKNVHDALHNQKFGKSVLSIHLKDRGIFVSHLEEKSDLVEYCSHVFTDFHNQEYIRDTLDSVKSKENYQSTKLECETQDLNLEEYCKIIQEEKKAEGQSVNMSITNNGNNITIESSYTEPDYGKSVMSQNLTKTACIRLEKTDAGIVVRGFSDDKSSEMSEQVIDLIKKDKEDKEESVKEVKVGLEGITSPQARTEFFQVLINSIDDYDMDDVKSVDVNNTKNEKIKPDAIEGYIKNAVLKGGSVLQSNEFKNLSNSGFYVTKIEWSAKSTDLKGDKVDFSAEFMMTDTSTNFVYSILRVYTRKKNNDYIKNGKMPSDMEKMKLLPLLEKSAVTAYDTIVAKYGVDLEDDREQSDE